MITLPGTWLPQRIQSLESPELINGINSIVLPHKSKLLLWSLLIGLEKKHLVHFIVACYLSHLDQQCKRQHYLIIFMRVHASLQDPCVFGINHVGELNGLGRNLHHLLFKVVTGTCFWHIPGDFWRGGGAIPITFIWSFPLYSPYSIDQTAEVDIFSVVEAWFIFRNCIGKHRWVHTHGV